MADDSPKVVKDRDIISQERDIIAQDRQELRLPAGVPLGIAVLGAARFNAVRRVFEQAERAAAAKAAYHDAQGAIADAITRREAAFEQLSNLDIVRGETSRRMRAAAAAAQELDEIAALKRQLEKMELEDRIRQVRGAAAPKPEPREQPTPSEEEEILAWFGKVPNFVKHAEAAKDEIIKNAGGADNVSDSLRAVCETLDAIVQAILSKKQEQAV